VQPVHLRDRFDTGAETGLYHKLLCPSEDSDIHASWQNRHWYSLMQLLHQVISLIDEFTLSVNHSINLLVLGHRCQQHPFTALTLLALHQKWHLASTEISLQLLLTLCLLRPVAECTTECTMLPLRLWLAFSNHHCSCTRGISTLSILSTNSRYRAGSDFKPQIHKQRR